MDQVVFIFLNIEYEIVFEFFIIQTFKCLR